MALGFGSIQRRIARVIDCEGEVYPSELAWRFAFEDREAPRVGQKLPDDLTLPSRAYVGVARAARQMTLHGEYELRSRRLSTYEDLERFYPYRTTQLRVVYARQRLIPSLLDYARRERLHVFDVERRRILYNDRAKSALRSARPDVCDEIGEELLDTVFDRWAFEPFVFARRTAKRVRTA
ncbi:MAG TPA: hypothetical protein VH054_10505 [Polyangiaceae bacterium]|jgi:hypothetical protein|nr:hypothetical protein [Polyangiaceae bacterium]